MEKKKKKLFIATPQTNLPEVTIQDAVMSDEGLGPLGNRLVGYVYVTYNS